MTSSPVLAILKLQHEKVRISVKNKLMSKISSYVHKEFESSHQTFAVGGPGWLVRNTWMACQTI